jgi:Tol biopolymer transport system component
VEWSWDDRKLLIPIFSKETKSSRLWLVSVADGQRRMLVSTGVYIQKAVSSPDGHYVAYEVQPKDQTSSEAPRIFVMPTEGEEPRLAFESSRGAFEPGPTGYDTRFNPLKDWTADGRFLAIKDVRQGKSALYLLPMKDGVATGPAEFVRYGEFDAASITASGALVYQEPATRPVQVAAFLASLDSAGHLGSWKPLALHRRLDNGISPFPSFSPDGRQIGYLAGDADPTRKDIVLRDITTGTDRVLYQSASKGLRCELSTSTPKLFCTESMGTGVNGKSELFSIAADSGSVERIAAFQESRLILQSPQDDKIFYFAIRGNTLNPIVRWDRSTQAETVLSALSDNFQGVTPSLDGRWLVRTLDNGTLQIQSTSGRDWRTLASGLTETMTPEVTPDGNWFLYHSTDPAGKASLFRAPVDGGEPQRLGGSPCASARTAARFSRPKARTFITTFGCGKTSSPPSGSDGRVTANCLRAVAVGRPDCQQILTDCGRGCD